MENYFDYTPASLLYQKVKSELSQNKEGYANRKISSEAIGC